MRARIVKGRRYRGVQVQWKWRDCRYVRQLGVVVHGFTVRPWEIGEGDET